MDQTNRQWNRAALASMFLQQSQRDQEADYARALSDAPFPRFDVIVLTASNEHQAEIFRAQLRTRALPTGTAFLVLPDRDGKRIGSGGATLAAIKHIKAQYGGFSGLRIAVLHSGGDGKRTPNYSAMGKLFSPVPRLLPTGRPSTLFDEFMISISSLAGRIREGMLVVSGDVMLLYNPLQIDFSGHGAAAISFKERVETAVNHGVFLADENGNVSRFLHKQSVETLTACGAVNPQGNVSIDTGAVIFAPDLLESLCSLVQTDAEADALIHPKTRLSFYGDFLFPLAAESTREAYFLETPEGELNEELQTAREKLWEVLRPFRMKLLNLSPAKFIHFGTTREVMALMRDGWREYEPQGWNNQVNSFVDGSTAAYGSILSKGAEIGDGCYLECSYLHRNAKVGAGCLLSFVDLHDETVPDHVVLHCLKQTDGRFVCRIYGVDDNPKQAKIFGISLQETGLTRADTLWDAALYPVCETVRQAVAAALNLYRLIVTGDGDRSAWDAAEKTSLCNGFLHSDPQAIIDWQQRMDDLVRMYRLEDLIVNGCPSVEAAAVFHCGRLTLIQEQWLERRLSTLDMNNPAQFGRAIRLCRYLAAALQDEELQMRWFRMISDTIQKNALANLQFREGLRIALDRVQVQLPLRVNWGGGWTDTPPYCMENGGTVLNCAILLDGQYPVCVTIEKLNENRIVFDSRDMDVHGEFDSIEALQRFGDPYDPFALQKACLAVCGILPRVGGELHTILSGLGGGFEIHSEVSNVPKGSGLGTSSILSAACVKAVLTFFGIPFTDDELYGYVLAMEQVMSTGGGWQDQVGGLTPGIKLITSEPGVAQKIHVEAIQIDEATKAELNERFCLVYTGQRRLARNLLRDVVGRYIGNVPESVQAHRQIRVLAVQMKEALQRGDVDRFAALLNEHFACSGDINPETTNTLIDHIIMAAADLIDGRFICGAGGGGFLQMILKKGVSREMLRERLKTVFQDFPVDVWDSQLSF